MQQHHRHQKPKKSPTSWEPVQQWYRNIVGEEGHYYHRDVIIPGILRLLNLDHPSDAVLDLACGEGVLARQLPASVRYVGIDISPSFIKEAKKKDANPNHAYKTGDVTKPLGLGDQHFTHATTILALQNIESPLNVFKQCHLQLKDQGLFIIVLNHPCFRIPRQSSWQVDESKKIQYRRIDRYLSPLQIPIQAHPSKGGESASTISFHYPLSAYTQWLDEAGFVIKKIEEWCSPKTSSGSKAKMENRSREEIPLFLTIVAKKIHQK